jgi:hypothetical protein
VPTGDSGRRAGERFTWVAPRRPQVERAHVRSILAVSGSVRHSEETFPIGDRLETFPVYLCSLPSFYLYYQYQLSSL